MPRKNPMVRVERGLYKSGATFVACVTPPGERQVRWRSLGEVGITQARRLRDEFAVEVRTGRAPRKGGKLTFAAVCDDYLTYCDQLVAVGEMAVRTREAYGYASRHLVKFFGHRDVRRITPNLLVAWHAEQRTTGAKTWTIKGRWQVLRLILGWAARQGMIPANPCDLLTSRERPKAGESRVRVLSDQEMTALLNAARGRFRVLIAVGMFTGVRISEAVGLVWGDIDFAAGEIRLRKQLTRKGGRKKPKSTAGVRDIVMMPTLASMLRRHRLDGIFTEDRDPVFGTSTRTAVSVRNATRAFNATIERTRYCPACDRDGSACPTCDGTGRVPGVEGVTFHTLRHTFASMLIAQGNDAVFVADQMGHGNAGFTLRTYAHLFRAAQQAQQTRDRLEDDYGALLRATGTEKQGRGNGDGA